VQMNQVITVGNRNVARQSVLVQFPTSPHGWMVVRADVGVYWEQNIHHLQIAHHCRRKGAICGGLPNINTISRGSMRGGHETTRLIASP
jgi:hypothetical protein